jgi:hypothetical protein
MMKDTFRKGSEWGAPWRPSSRIEGLNGPFTTVAFAGIFNSGKSSLLNRLIGRETLPTGPLPETGCPVRLVHSEAVEQGDKIVFPGEAGMRDLTSLHDTNGQPVKPVVGSQGITLALDRPAFPVGAALVDLPGVNDDATLRRLSARVADASDAVVMVLNSRQFLSLPEQGFLAGLIARRGSTGLAIAINMFMVPGIPQNAWIDRTMAAFSERLDVFLLNLGLDPAAVPIFAVVAAENGGDPMGGLARLIDWITYLGGANSPAVQASRNARADIWRAALRDRIAPAQARADAALAQAIRQIKEHEKQAAATSAFLLEDLPKIFDQSEQDLSDCLGDITDEVRQSILENGLDRSSTYTTLFNSKIEDLGLGGRICAQVTLNVAARGLPPPRVGLRKALEKETRLNARRVVIADTPLGAGRVAAIGLAGSIVTFGIGAIAGAAAYAHAVSRKNERDKELTLAGLELECCAAFDEFCGTRTSVFGAVKCHLSSPPHPVDPSILRQRISELEGRVRRAGLG